MPNEIESESRMTREQRLHQDCVRHVEPMGSESANDKRNASKLKNGATIHSFVQVESLQEPKLWTETTQSIDLTTLLTSDVSTSGSFDIRGDIWASTFGKLLEALPIPALLVDKDSRIAIGNHGFVRLSSDWPGCKRIPFADLFLDSVEAKNALAALREVFMTRKSKSFMSFLLFGDEKIWARLTLRSIRIVKLRFVMVLVEDLTHERKLLELSRNYQQDLKKRVKERTTELEKTSRRLQIEISERKKAEERLIQTERLRAVGEMSSGVAHNLRNLLQMLMFLTHSASERVRKEDAPGALTKLEGIADTLGHAAETMNRLRDFAQLTTGRHEAPEKVFDLTSALGKAIELMKPLWRTNTLKQGHAVELRTRLREGCMIKGNESQIFEVLVNLIKNAVEAMPEGGVIDVKCGAVEDKVVFAIRDTGVGISAENIRKLFTPFFTTKAEMGTGLGLAASRSIVHGHGGTITARNNDGEGATFTVTFPRASTKPCPEASLASTPEDQQLRILLVDDSDSNLLVLKASLEERRHLVCAATSGEDALKTFEVNHVDLVLCDLAMPGMNGWEVGRRMKKLCEEKEVPKPPFVLLTGWGRQSREDSKMIESGVDAVVEKPVALDRLVHIVGEITQ
ncbi:MAG: ATP-binding protein [Deltaproteobacteria bacterium]